MNRSSVTALLLCYCQKHSTMLKCFVGIGTVSLALTFFVSGAGASFFGDKGQREGVCHEDHCPPVPEQHEQVADDLGKDSQMEQGISNQNRDARDVEEKQRDDTEINVIITFTKAVQNWQLQNQFTLTVSSMLKHSTMPLAIHIIGEEESQKLAAKIIKENAQNAQYRMVHLDVDDLAHRLADIVKPMQERFSYKPGAYYHHSLFFLSTAIHKVMPESMDKVIMMDADLKFRDDIKLLYDQFDKFQDSNIIGIAHEMQPVYRHLFWYVRNHNKKTRVGEPPPHGLPGFNSGVLLLSLDRMRKSELYNKLILKENVDRFAEEFNIKGHLGDQDFFTVVGMKHEELFYVLPCVFNRQLNTWWRDNGYKDVFHLYHTCEGDVKIYHGNGKTKIPDD